MENVACCIVCRSILTLSAMSSAWHCSLLGLAWCITTICVGSSREAWSERRSHDSHMYRQSDHVTITQPPSTTQCFEANIINQETGSHVTVTWLSHVHLPGIPLWRSFCWRCCARSSEEAQTSPRDRPSWGCHMSHRTWRCTFSDSPPGFSYKHVKVQSHFYVKDFLHVYAYMYM